MEDAKKKEGFFKRMGKDLRLQVGFCVASVLVLIALYFPLSILAENEAMLNRIITEDNNMLMDISSVRSTEEKLILSGWIIHLNVELKDIQMIMIPSEQELQSGWVLNTSPSLNAELERQLKYLAIGDTKGSGFNAEINRKRLKSDVCYEIQLCVTYELENEQTSRVSLKQYLYNEKLYTYNPLKFTAPVVADEQMVRVVEEGYLLGYVPEHGAWVYQYENSLYWILDKKNDSNLDENLYMFWHLNTPHIELLPEYRRQYGFDNKDFAFKTYELEIEENYRVAKRELAEAYPVTYIATGHYAGGENLWVVKNKMELQK